MSCTTNNKPYVKIGDSLDVPIQMVDSTTGEGIEITPSMSFSCSIINLLGEVIATPTVTPYPDQVTDTGYMLLSVPTSVTSTWQVGKVKTDIKMTVGGSVRHSQEFSFYVVGAITP